MLLPGAWSAAFCYLFRKAWEHMGGYGSGRQGGRATVEGTASFIFDIRALTRRGLKSGVLGEITLVWSDYWTDEDFSVGVVVNTSEMRCPHIELAHRCRVDQPEVVRYRVRLLTMRPHYGGLRWWFECPHTRRRVAKLCLPLGGWQFWSTRAYDLAYQSQREQQHERTLRKLQSIRTALGGPEYTNLMLPFPPKPKGMWWRTYERLVDRADGAQAITYERLGALAAQLHRG